MMKTAVRSLACLPLFLAHLWAQQLDVMFVLESSPGTEQQIGLIRPRDLKEGDRAGIIGYTRSAYLLQSLTEDREALAKALQRAGMRITIGPYSDQTPAGGRRSPGAKPFKATQSISREHCAKHFANLVIGVLKCESM
jgi:hypothetical protein